MDMSAGRQGKRWRRSGRDEQHTKATVEKLATAQTNCMTVAADHDTSVASRAVDLKVIAEAGRIATSMP